MCENNFNSVRTFRVLGIRPLRGCNKHILKNLEEETFYALYDNYKYENDYVIKKYKSSVPDNFFSSRINIHAIVGVNGCGKSTVVEFLIRIINNLAYHVIGEVNSFAADKLIPVKKLRAELYYELNEIIYCVKITDNIIEWRDENKKKYGKRNDLNFLYYTLVINYSQYAYNSLDYKSEIIGRYKKKFWIESIFHKNDGYLTPIVLNPYRDKGNIDINRETNLAIQRLMSLFVHFLLNNKSFHPDYELFSFRLNLDADSVIWKYQKAKTTYWKYLENIQNIDFETVEELILKAWSSVTIRNKSLDGKMNDLIDKYLVYKTMSVILKYNPFLEYYHLQVKDPRLKGKLYEQLANVVSKIYNDKTHITLKIRQLISFMNLNAYKAGNYSREEILDKFRKCYNKLDTFSLDRIMDLLPPPIFRTDFNLSYKNKKKRIVKVPITDLSSGERQMLYSLSSVLYHLHNLDSVRGEDRVAYDNFQIILEEVEQYYHPEYQRKYVQTLIEYINFLGISENKCIDILIITHSPFILSDIPRENILFLEKGSPVRPINRNNTFCANYYDLLRYDFFLSKHAFGAFAQEKINKIQQDLEDHNELELGKLEEIKETIALIGDEFLNGYFQSKCE